MTQQVIDDGALPTKVSLRVPATTANLGPAYDALGMALSIFMDVTVEHAEVFSLTMEGEGVEHITCDEKNMIVQTCRAAFSRAGKPMPPLKFTVKSNIPYGCGCGSSSAAAVAGFVAGMRLAGLRLPVAQSEELLKVVTAIEGHPDNAAPAIYGGLQLGYTDEAGQIHTKRVPLPPNLTIVLFVPYKLMKASTHVTRDLVPQTVSLKDALHNVSRAALLVLALTTGNLTLLAQSTDRLHEQQRASALYPHYAPCAAAAQEAGAVYTFLSGAGPAVCAFVAGRCGELQLQTREECAAEQIGLAMVRAAAGAGVDGRAIITQPSELGVHLSGTHTLAPHLQQSNI